MKSSNEPIDLAFSLITLRTERVMHLQCTVRYTYYRCLKNETPNDAGAQSNGRVIVLGLVLTVIGIFFLKES